MVNLKQEAILHSKVENTFRRATNTPSHEEAIASINELKKLMLEQQEYIKELIAENEVMREYILDKTL